MIIEEIIRTKLNPRLFERQNDFIDCVRLLGDIIDNYPYDQQIVKISLRIDLKKKKQNFISSRNIYPNFMRKFFRIQEQIMRNY